MIPLHKKLIIKSARMNLMLNGPDKGFVRKLAALMPPEQKHKWKATLTDQLDVVMVEVDVISPI